MKIVHLMRNEKFTKGIVRFYNKFFNNTEHEIVYYLQKGEPSLVNKEFSIEQREYRAIKKNGLIPYLKSLKCDYIVLHSLFLTTTESISLLLDQKLLNKIVWIEWGADLYSWKQEANLRNIVRNYFNGEFRNRIPNIVCIFPPDVDYYRKTFPKSKSNVFYAPYKGYPIDKAFSKYSRESKLEAVKKESNPIYIQIGQNSLPTLNHIKVLNYLRKYADENIRIFLPLSYGGTKGYVESVSRVAESYFPGKVIILKDFMDRNEYFKLMNNISIGIFDTERQCGLGNIHLLSFRNVKLFLSENGTMYEYFLKRGVPVEKCESISNMTFEQFTKVPEVRDKNEFEKYISELSDINLAVSLWEKFYKDMREKLNEG